MPGCNAGVSSDNNDNKNNNTITTATTTVSNLFSCSGALLWGKWNSDIKKGNILTNFEKSTLIVAIIVMLTGLIVYGHISRGIFGPSSYPHVYAQGFSRI